MWLNVVVVVVSVMEPDVVSLSVHSFFCTLHIFVMSWVRVSLLRREDFELDGWEKGEVVGSIWVERG